MRHHRHHCNAFEKIHSACCKDLCMTAAVDQAAVEHDISDITDSTGHLSIAGQHTHITLDHCAHLSFPKLAKHCHKLVCKHHAMTSASDLGISMPSQQHHGKAAPATMHIHSRRQGLAVQT